MPPSLDRVALFAQVFESGNSEAAPATVSGEPLSIMPLSKASLEASLGRRATALIREPGDLPVPVILPSHGACEGAVFRSGDVT